jgi:hypothetical protein
MDPSAYVEAQPTEAGRRDENYRAVD